MTRRAQSTVGILAAILTVTAPFKVSAQTTGQGGAGGGGGAGAAGNVAGTGGTAVDQIFGGGGGGAGIAGGGGGNSNGTGAGAGATTAGGTGSNGTSGGGGGGAHGVVATPTTTNAATITGGGGGTGGNGGGAGGGGGDAGFGAAVTSAITYTNHGTISGGTGGAGGTGGGGFTSGNGGDGGIGLATSVSGVAIVNTATISGGTGGNGGDNGGGGFHGGGGAGGTGIFASGATITNSGTISGGSGGSTGSGGQGGTGLAAGGAAIAGANLTITNSGHITSGGPTANAITFTGGANTLTLQNGSVISGNIDVTGSLDLSQPTNTTLSNNITGTGSVSKSGAGALILTGANTFSGGMTVTAGSLQGTTSSLQGDIVNNATIAVTQTTTGTYGGNMSGTGSLLVNGTATVILGGTNSYSGGTTVSSGTLQGTTSSLQGSIVNNAIVAFNQSTTGTYAGNMSGTGSLLVNGTGTVILSGTNSYSGGTTVSSGTLQGTTSSLQGGILNNALVTFKQSTAGTYASSISGTGGVNIQGGGTTTFSGINSYAGPTTVTGSGLVVTGSLASAVTLDATSSLGGTGTIGGLVVNGGTLAPGGLSIGTLTVNGSFAQNAGTYVVAVNAQGQNSRTNISGTATLNGGTVQVVAAPGTYGTSTTYTILNASGGVSGTYSSVASNLAFLTPSLSYDAKDVYLTLVFTGFAGSTTNQNAVGNALNQSVTATSAPPASSDFAIVTNALMGLSSQQAGQVLTAISGQPYADTGTATVGASLLFLNALGQQVAAARGKGEPGTRIAVAEACDVACDDTPPARLSAWMSGVGGFGSIGGNGNAGTLTYNFGGAAAGIDYRLDPRFLMGVAVSYTGGRQWVDGFNGQGNTNNYSTALYASFTQSGFYADALAGYAYSDTQMQRVLVIPGLQPRMASGGTGTNQFLGQLEAGYGIGIYQKAQAILTPFARLQTVAAAQNGFTESGSVNSLGLIVAPQNTTSVRTVLGTDLAGSAPVGATNPLAITLRLGWAHEYASTDRSSAAAFQGAPSASFTVYGAQPQRDAAVIGLGLQNKIAEAVSLYARYDGEISGRDSAHALTAGLRMSW